MAISYQCIVLIPVYKSLDSDEVEVLRQAIRMTPHFVKKFIAPESLSFDDSFDEFRDMEVERFDDSFFVDIQGYNRLMLDLYFYQRFKDFKYMLIHQTDAFLFKDELQYWCDKNYDYIGAPWYIQEKLYKLNRYKYIFRYCKLFFKRQKLLKWRHYNNVGNGGLSLRKINTFIEVLKNADKKLLDLYRNKESNFFHEDIFWSLEVPEKNKKFTKPMWDEALLFSIESYPRESYEYLGETLPFGCHAFKRTDAVFWSKFIPFLNQ